MTEMGDFTAEELTGTARTHVRELAEDRCMLHNAVIAPFATLRAAAARSGIDLRIASGFRDFDRQLGIWNGKFRGERPMQDRAERRLDALTLTPAERVRAISWWSALPGASRHHWGTDFDVFDAAACPAGYRPQLVALEYAPGGVFHRLTTWLDEHMHAFGFFRPFGADRGGVLPESWHLSYAPLAEQAARALTPALLRTVIGGADIEGKTEVLAGLGEYFDRFVSNVDRAPQAALLSPRLS